MPNRYSRTGLRRFRCGPELAVQGGLVAICDGPTRPPTRPHDTRRAEVVPTARRLAVLAISRPQQPEQRAVQP